MRLQSNRSASWGITRGFTVYTATQDSPAYTENIYTQHTELANCDVLRISMCGSRWDGKEFAYGREDLHLRYHWSPCCRDF